MNNRLNTSTVAGFFALTGGFSAVALKWGSWDVISPHWTGSINGIDLPYGGAIGVIYLLLMLYLIATGPLLPPPVWRPIGTLVFALLAGIVFLLYGYGPGRNWMHFPGPWITIISTLTVLVIATFELRGAFVRRMEQGAKCERDASALH